MVAFANTDLDDDLIPHDVLLSDAERADLEAWEAARGARPDADTEPYAFTAVKGPAACSLPIFWSE